jgi:hypothetical protein
VNVPSANGHAQVVQPIAVLNIALMVEGRVVAQFQGPRGAAGRSYVNAMCMGAMQDLAEEFKKQERGDGIEIARPA